MIEVDDVEYKVDMSLFVNPEDFVFEVYFLPKSKLAIAIIEKETPVDSRVTPFSMIRYDYNAKIVEELAQDFSMGNISNIKVSPGETHIAFESTWAINACLIESRINVLNLIGKGDSMTLSVQEQSVPDGDSDISPVYEMTRWDGNAIDFVKSLQRLHDTNRKHKENLEIRS